MNMLKLIIMQLKVGYGISVLRWYWSNNRMKFIANLGLGLLILVALGPIFFVYWRVLDGVYLGAAMFGQGQAVIASGLIGGSLIVFFFGIAYVMSAFYFSRDLNFLLALPLRPAAVMAAKFSVVLISNYITLIPLVLPALYVYGYYNGFSATYLLLGAVVFLITPFLPLSMAAVFVMLLMRYTNLAQRRDTVRMAGMIALLLMIVFLNVFLTQIPEGMEAEYIQEILSREEGLIGYMGRIFPPALLATRVLIYQGMQALLNLLYFAGVSLIATGMAVWIGDRTFYQGLIGGSEVIARKSMTVDALERRFDRSRHPVWAIADREIKALLRTPIYFFNSIAIIFIVPALLIIPVFFSGGLNQIEMALELIESRVLILLALAGFIGATALFAPAASSSFSREGRTFWISKVMPVAPMVHIHGKILYSFLITLLAVPLVLVAVIYLVPVTVGEFILIVCMGLVFAFPAITSNLLMDFLRPFLTWDDPQRAIKQNMNVLIGMVVGGVLLYLVYLAVNFTITSGWKSGGVMIVAMAAAFMMGLVPYGVMWKIARSQFSRIEV